MKAKGETVVLIAFIKLIFAFVYLFAGQILIFRYVLWSTLGFFSPQWLASGNKITLAFVKFIICTTWENKNVSHLSFDTHIYIFESVFERRMKSLHILTGQFFLHILTHAYMPMLTGVVAVSSCFNVENK